MDNLITIQNYLSNIGLEGEATRLYIELVKTGPSSALQLARNTKISRTQTYRYLEELQNKGLASAEQLSYGTLFRALPLENIESVIAQREAETATLRGDLGTMTEVLRHIAGSNGPTATVHHHYGLAGLKQVNWNLTKAEKEFKVFEAASLSQHLDPAFARRCRERFIERGIKSYDLTNKTEVPAAEIEPFNPAKALYRHIDPNVLTINFEMYIYNDVVTLLDYTKDQQHALEIHHPTLNAMMNQLYDSMWNLGQPIEITQG